MLCGNFKRRIDGQGRIGIPGNLRNDLRGGEVVVAGCGDHVEIWPRKQWEVEQAKMRKTLDKINR